MSNNMFLRAKTTGDCLWYKYVNLPSLSVIIINNHNVVSVVINTKKP